MSESEYFAPDADRPIRVAKDTHPRDLGLLLAKLLFNNVEHIVLTCMGAAAVNQAVKGVAVARIQLNKAGRDCAFLPSFEEVPDADGEERTLIRFAIEERAVAATGAPL